MAFDTFVLTMNAMCAVDERHLDTNCTADAHDSCCRCTCSMLCSTGIMWHVACGMWHVACGMRHVACGMWHVACGMWHAACGMRMRHAACAMCHVPCAMCHVPCGMHVACACVTSRAFLVARRVLAALTPLTWEGTGCDRAARWYAVARHVTPCVQPRRRSLACTRACAPALSASVVGRPQAWAGCSVASSCCLG